MHPSSPYVRRSLVRSRLRRMLTYSSHERCTTGTPRVRPLSRKHRPRTRRRVGRAAAVQPLGAALRTRSRFGPVRTCPFPLARACVGMRVWVCVCALPVVGVLRMTSTVRGRPAVSQITPPEGAKQSPTCRPGDPNSRSFKLPNRETGGFPSPESGRIRTAGRWVPD